MKNITTMNLIEILKTISLPNQPFTDAQAQKDLIRILRIKSIPEKVSELQKTIALELVRRGKSRLNPMIVETYVCFGEGWIEYGFEFKEKDEVRFSIPLERLRIKNIPEKVSELQKTIALELTLFNTRKNQCLIIKCK